jgi:hypothetical protein
VGGTWCINTVSKGKEKVTIRMILENTEEPVFDSDVSIIFMEKIDVLLVLMVYIFSLLFVLLIISSIL